MKLALLLITVLLLGTLQCVAGCAMITGDPPCHHDQKSQVACAHELVLQTPPAIAIAAETPPASFEAPSILSESAPYESTFARFPSIDPLPRP